jgi:addiction module HigA family antidote
MDKSITSSLVIHPGEMIRDEIDARGITVAQLAEKMDVPQQKLDAMLDGKCPVSADYAMMLEAALGIDAGIWLRLQIDYDMQVRKKDNSFLAKLEKIRKMAAVF